MRINNKLGFNLCGYVLIVKLDAIRKSDIVGVVCTEEGCNG